MRADRIASIVFMLTAVVFWSQTGDLRYDGRIFPRFVIVFFLILSAIMFGRTFIAKRAEERRIMPEHVGYIIASIVVVFVWVYLLSRTGFIISSVAMLTLLTAILDLERPTFSRIMSSLAIYALMVFTFWFIFHKFLLVPLPTGYLI
jgi:hypothetical protein